MADQGIYIIDSLIHSVENMMNRGIFKSAMGQNDVCVRIQCISEWQRVDRVECQYGDVIFNWCSQALIMNGIHQADAGSVVQTPTDENQ